MATITADRILDLIPVIIMLFASMIYVYIRGVYSLFSILIVLNLLLLILTGIATLIMMSERRIKRVTLGIFNLLARLIPSKVRKYEERVNQLIEINVPHFTQGLKLVARNRRASALSLAYSFATWFFVILRNYFIFLSLGHPVSFMSVVVVQMTATAVGLIGIIPGGAGLVEATLAGSFVLLGVEREVAVTASILDRIVSFWLPLLLGVVFMARSGLKPRTSS